MTDIDTARVAGLGFEQQVESYLNSMKRVASVVAVHNRDYLEPDFRLYLTTGKLILVDAHFDSRGRGNVIVTEDQRTAYLYWAQTHSALSTVICARSSNPKQPYCGFHTAFVQSMANVRELPDGKPGYIVPYTQYSMEQIIEGLVNL